MREILFRGKRKDNGEWVEGSLIHIGEFCAILEDDCEDYGVTYLNKELGTIDGVASMIIPETIGQYIGVKDKNGNKVFEGDIVKTRYGRLCVVEWFSSTCSCSFDLNPVPGRENIRLKAPGVYDLFYPKYLEVVGNIHDNPINIMSN